MPFNFEQWGVKTPKAKHKHPNLCDLCGTPIKVDDKYYIGLTHISKEKRIWAFTCLHYNCIKWLVVKKLFTKDE